jgi:predicted DNA-binding transcriptional regulator AlpA
MARSRASALATSEPTTNTTQRHVISLRRTAEKTGYSVYSMARKIKEPGFPKPIRFSTHRLGFYEEEIDAWIASKQDA